MGNAPRYYDVPELGGQIPSVTSVTSLLAKPGIVKNFWAKLGIEEATNQLDAAAERGKEFHEWVKFYMTQAEDLAHVSETTKPYVESFLMWARDRDFKRRFRVFAVERAIAGRPGVAGTFDALLWDEEEKRYSLCDWKSNAEGEVYPEYLIQTAQYASMVEDACMDLNGEKGWRLHAGYAWPDLRALKDARIIARIITARGDGRPAREYVLRDIIPAVEAFDGLKKAFDFVHGKASWRTQIERIKEDGTIRPNRKTTVQEEA